MTYSTSALIRQMEEGQRAKYLFFWGHTPNTNDRVTKACLSQWYESPFVVEGITYLTTEHWMMAEKARLFSDQEIQDLILSSVHPGEAKKLGRKVKAFDPKIWDAHKLDIVIAGNQHKFSQNTDLGDFLRQTQKRVLVEAPASTH